MVLSLGSLCSRAFLKISGVCIVAVLAPAATPASALPAPTTTTVTASANPIPSGSPVTFTARSFSTGRASVGAKLTYRSGLSGTTAIVPFVGIYADNYFLKDDGAGAVVPAVMQGTSARILGGVAVTTDYGLKFSSSGELGGSVAILPRGRFAREAPYHSRKSDRATSNWGAL